MAETNTDPSVSRGEWKGKQSRCHSQFTEIFGNTAGGIEASSGSTPPTSHPSIVDPPRENITDSPEGPPNLLYCGPYVRTLNAFPVMIHRGVSLSLDPCPLQARQVEAVKPRDILSLELFSRLKTTTRSTSPFCTPGQIWRIPRLSFSTKSSGTGTGHALNSQQT